MKKITFIASICIVAISANAQLKVESAGNVGIAISTPVSAASLSVGHNDGYNYSSYAFGIRSERNTNKQFNIAIAGRSWNSNSSSGRSIGLQGVAGGGMSGLNYGVIGGLIESTGNGAGIFGTTLQHTGVYIPGRYAGYFNGEVYVENNITAASFISPSDIRLKQNIESVKEATRAGSTLENVLNMNVIKYNYIDFHKPAKNDTATVDLTDPTQDITADIHYGLSAQELQNIYPDLVKKGQDGYFGINYVELVPILIRSIQELKQQLDEVSCKKDEETAKARVSNNGFDEDETEDISDATTIPTSTASLAQNTPNPFTERTTIRFTLPDDTKNACICIFDMSGKMLKQVPVDASMQSITIEGYELQAGMYIYSLLINGKEIKTRRMILSK